MLTIETLILSVHMTLWNNIISEILVFQKRWKLIDLMEPGEIELGMIQEVHMRTTLPDHLMSRISTIKRSITTTKRIRNKRTLIISMSKNRTMKL